MTMLGNDNVEGDGGAGSKSPNSPNSPKSPLTKSGTMKISPMLTRGATLEAIGSVGRAFGDAALAPLSVLKSEKVNYLAKDFHPSALGWFTGSDNHRFCSEKKTSTRATTFGKY